MVQFPRKKQQDRSEPAEGQSISGGAFLKEARGRLSAIIGQYAAEENHAAYETVEDLLAALEEELWPEAENLLKESYRNGSRSRRR